MAEIRAPARCVRPSRQRIESWWVVSPRPSDRHAELDVGPLPAARRLYTPLVELGRNGIGADCSGFLYFTDHSQHVCRELIGASLEGFYAALRGLRQTRIAQFLSSRLRGLQRRLSPFGDHLALVLRHGGKGFVGGMA